MKKVSFVILVLLCLSFYAEAKRVDGRIIFEKDTIDVVFKLPVGFLSKQISFETLQHRVKYFDENKKKQTLYPKNAKEIVFHYRGEDIRMLSQDNPLSIGVGFLDGPRIFLKLEIDGKLKLYKYYTTQKSPGSHDAVSTTTDITSSYQEEMYVLQKNDDELKRIKTLTFRSDMMEYFASCPALVELIDNKSLKRRDLETIVEFYNTNCM